MSDKGEKVSFEETAISKRSGDAVTNMEMNDVEIMIKEDAFRKHGQMIHFIHGMSGLWATRYGFP